MIVEDSSSPDSASNVLMAIKVNIDTCSVWKINKRGILRIQTELRVTSLCTQKSTFWTRAFGQGQLSAGWNVSMSKTYPKWRKMYEWYSNLHWVKAMLLSNWFLENLGCTYCRMATNIKGSFRFCVRSHSVWMDPHMWNMSWAISPKCRWQIIFVILISFSHYFWRIQL